MDETCHLYIMNMREKVMEMRQSKGEEEEEGEKILERIRKENEEKLRKEKEFYELLMQSQEILNNSAKVDYYCELERNSRWSIFKEKFLFYL